MDNDTKIYIGICLCVVGLVIMTVLIQSYFEMSTFNKFSHKTKATIIDALFSNLRVLPD